jgi:hypothetical protein
MPDAEVDVGDVMLDLSARADRADEVPFADRVASPNGRRAEMRQGHRVAVGRLDRHGSAAHGHRAGERDGAGRRCKDGLSGRRADVDSPVLARGVRIVAEDELLEHRAFDGPGPGPCGGHDCERGREHDDQGSTHLLPPCCPYCQQRPRYLEHLVVVNMDYRELS